MNRNLKIIVGIILFLSFCGMAIAGWGIYTLWNNPAMQNGIRNAGDELTAMVDLQQKILDVFPCQDAGVEIVNGTSLNVTLVNSEYGNLPYQDQARKAREIASFVEDNYTGNANLEGITITFTQNKNIGPLTTNRSTTFSFNISELK